MKILIYLLLFFVFSFNALSQDKENEWNEFRLGMSMADAKVLLQERCNEIVEEDILTGYDCGIYFKKKLDISLHKKYKYLFFSPYVSRVFLSIKTQEKSDAIHIFNYLKKKYKTNQTYYRGDCVNNTICIWYFGNYKDVQLWLVRGMSEKSTYRISVGFRDLLKYH